MGEVFQGWRRKTGCVTLLMALVVLAAWGRSQIRQGSIMSPPLGGGIQYQACLRSSEFFFQKTRAITIGDNETLSCRDGNFILSGVNQSNSGDQAGRSVESHSGRPISFRVLALTNPGSISFSTDGSEFSDGNSNRNHPEWRVLSISGPTTVCIECGQTVVPYWALITPLTLVSAYLLLTKSRAAASMESVKPINDKNE